MAARLDPDEGRCPDRLGLLDAFEIRRLFVVRMGEWSIVQRVHHARDSIALRRLFDDRRGPSHMRDKLAHGVRRASDAADREIVLGDDAKPPGSFSRSSQASSMAADEGIRGGELLGGNRQGCAHRPPPILIRSASPKP